MFLWGREGMYTVIDLIDKLIEIDRSSEEYYLKISEDDRLKEKIKVLTKALAKKDRRHIDRYLEIRSKIQDGDDVEIDFFTYDKAVKLIYEFTGFREKDEFSLGIKGFVLDALEFEKESLALVMRIRGLLVNSEADTYKENYKILTSIVELEKSHVKDIEGLKEYIS